MSEDAAGLGQDEIGRFADALIAAVQRSTEVSVSTDVSVNTDRIWDDLVDEVLDNVRIWLSHDHDYPGNWNLHLETVGMGGDYGYSEQGMCADELVSLCRRWLDEDERRLLAERLTESEEEHQENKSPPIEKHDRLYGGSGPGEGDV